MAQAERLGLVFPRSGQKIFVDLPQHVVNANSKHLVNRTQMQEDRTLSRVDLDATVKDTVHGA
jgi:hypothetical protein